MREPMMCNAEIAELTDDDLSIVVAGTVKPSSTCGEIRGESTKQDQDSPFDL